MTENKGIEEKVVGGSKLDRLYYGSSWAADFVPGSQIYFGHQEHKRAKEQGIKISFIDRLADYTHALAIEGLRLMAYPCGAMLLYNVGKSFGLF